MQVFFQTSFLFWYGFVFSFLLCTGAGAFIQCWFLINLGKIKSKKSHYMVYLFLSYAMYLLAVSTAIRLSPMVDTLFGAGVIFVFSHKKLKQNYVQSAIGAALTMAVTALAESVELLMQTVIDKANVMTEAMLIMQGLLFLLISFVICKFVVYRYSVKSRYQTNYLIVFSLPLFFISVMLRMINYIRYTTTVEGVILQSDSIGTYEATVVAVIAFLCILTVLFAYEKTIRQTETDNQKTMLQVQVAAQENYVAEARQKYETTKAFRHDFKNHIVALRGLIDAEDFEKASVYMERFEQTYEGMSFAMNTGNSVLDILLGEKLSYAEKMNIHVKCDIAIPEKVKVDDFDLCAIFANTIDNAIKACSSMENREKIIDIVAKPKNSFFIIDMLNHYQAGCVAKGSGMGLTIVRIIVEKYGGAVEILDDDNVYRISVILPFDQ